MASYGDGDDVPSPSPATTPARLTSASPPRSPSPTQDREARLVAIERRQAAARSADSAAEYRPFDADHEKRQKFRRLIDPGIMRPNPVDVARASLRVMSRRHLSSLARASLLFLLPTLRGSSYIDAHEDR